MRAELKFCPQFRVNDACFPSSIDTEGGASSEESAAAKIDVRLFLNRNETFLIEKESKETMNRLGKERKQA